MENEKLIAALRETQSLGDAPVGLFWGVIVTKELVKECIDALERLTAESAEKDAEIERLKEQIAADSQLKSGLDNANALCRTYKADRDRLQAELDAAKSCIAGIEEALKFQRWSGAALRISEWRGKENGDGKENS